MNLWRFPCSIKASSVGLRVSAKAKAFSCLTLLSLFKLGLTTQHQQDVETVTIGLQTFYEVGCALGRRRNRKSDKLVEGYSTFEAFCSDKWEMGKRQAYYLIDAGQVIANENNCSQIPTNETQARKLAQLKTPEAQREAWEIVLQLVKKGRKLTAQLVREVVDGFIEAEFADDPSGETLGNPDYEEAQEESRYAWESVWPFFLP